MQKIKNEAEKNKFVDPLSVNWSEKYDKQLTTFWNKIPKFLREILVFLAVFSFGITVNGQWINLWVHISKQFGYYPTPTVPSNDEDWSLEAIGLKNFWTFLFLSNLVSYSIYFSVGGFIHWYYYVRQRDQPEKWKCQPTKFLTPELERHELILGSCSLLWSASVAALTSCYIANGGYSTVYYDVSEYGFPWFFIQLPLIFIYQDYVVYWIHRMYHFPWLYKNFHKLHHTYKQPTAWSVTAIHPVEITTVQFAQWLPLFVAPLHWAPFYAALMYAYYHGIIDHSGVNFKSFWWQPWQPDAIFHDNHHQYTHVNFGFNIYLWDVLHGTYRQKDRIYNEDTFYGKGKSLKEATREEIEVEVKERNSENPLAYRNNKLEYQLDKEKIDN